VLVLGLGFVLGCVLLGVAMIRDNYFPRVAAALLIVGALILLLPLPLNDVIFGGAMSLLGYMILREASERVQTSYDEAPKDSLQAETDTSG
jgi:predicted MFS family arabinose efflux permease